jgi:hypothetical protein
MAIPRTPEDKLAAMGFPGRLWSYSALHRWEECPRAFFGRYIAGVPEVIGRPLVLGTLTHTLIALALAEPTPITDWRPLVTKARRRVDQASLVERDADPQIVQWAQDALAAIPAGPERLVETVWVLPLPAASGPRPAPPRLQKPVADLVAGVRYARFRVEDALRQAGWDGIEARPDLVLIHRPSRRILIRDFKTSRARRPADLVPRYRTQLALYGAVARRQFPGYTLVFDLHAFAADGIVRVPLEPADFDATARWVFQRTQAIKAAARAGPAAFPPTPSFACRFCPLAALSPDDAAHCALGAAHAAARGWTSASA